MKITSKKVKIPRVTLPKPDTPEIKKHINTFHIEKKK